MGGEILLDTNIAILFAAADKQVTALFREANSVFLPVIVVAEMFFGAMKSQRVHENIRSVEQLLATVDVVPCDTTTARHYGTIKSRLRAAGRMIPENDLWIAAIALQRGMTLATRDHHFDGIEGVETCRW
jgi:tRNA(fMet)-specific endonuclease VapC